MARTTSESRATTTPDGTTWSPPAGSWTSAADHLPHALTAEYCAIYFPAREQGFRDMFTRYGIPADTYEGVVINGRQYDRVRPLVGADKDGPPPPAPILKVAARLHPEFRRRTRLMTETLRVQRWREDHRRWWEEIRPDLEARAGALAAVAVVDLDDAGLARHLGDAEALAREGIHRHFDLKGLDSFPLGDLLALTRRHGIPSTDVVDIFRGLSPASRPPEELAVLSAAVASALAGGASRPGSIDELRALSPEVADRFDAFLLRRGHCLLTGYDISAATLAEQPAVLLASVLALVDVPATGGYDVGEPDAERAREVRDRLPEADRAAFDERVAEAALGYPVRDDNGPITFQWPMGLLRRAMLEAGRRLAERGALSEPLAAIDATVPELTAALTGVGARSDLSRVVDARRATRARQDQLVPPLHLGAPDAPPPLAALPAPLARAVDAVDAFVSTMVGNTARPDDRRPLHGDGVGNAPYCGRAVVAASAEDALSRIEPGCVLVTTATTPAFNSAMFLAGAVVTEEGGPLSHAALVARETGIPTVVGAGGATTLIKDGDEVEVDPTTGRVTVRHPVPA